MRVVCACGCVHCGENEGVGGVGRGKEGGREKSFKDQGAPMGATFSLPVTSCSLTEETRTDRGSWFEEGWPLDWGTGEKRAEGAPCAPGSGPISKGTLQLSQVHRARPRPHSFPLMAINWSGCSL